MFSLEGHTALVTGATGGLGQEIVKVLHGQGANLILSGTRKQALETLAHTYQERVEVVAARLNDGDDVARLAKQASAPFGAVDILVNNAGLTRDNLAMRMKDEEWDDVLNVNLTASFKLSRALLRGMMKKRWGRMIGITSIVGVTGNPGQMNYAASKAGMIGMYKSLAQEVASRGITANCIAPGFIKTAMTDALSQEQQETLTQAIPARRMGTPLDIATAVLFLASPESSYITGQTLHINGGMAMI